MTTPTTTPGGPLGAGIGKTLRAARTERGLSLADLQARTKIRSKYLAALEDERFSELPPFPFARGFLQAVAAELGLESAPLVERLSVRMKAADVPHDDISRLDTAVQPAVRPSPLRRVLMWVGVVAVLAAVILAVSFYRQMREFGRPEPQAVPSAPGPDVSAPPTVPPPGAAPGVIPTPGAQGTAAPGIAPTPPLAMPTEPAPSGETTPAPGAAASPDASAGVPPGTGVALQVEATGRCWLLVVSDGRSVYEGFVSSGETRRWQAKTSVRIRMGNAGALRVTVNGKALGTLGGPGVVIDRTFVKDDVR